MSKRKKKPRMEFRYYKMPEGMKFFALLGEKWIQHYGQNVDFLHFHNYMELGYCYEGSGILTLGNEKYRFEGGEFSVIPRNFPHTTTSDDGTISRWEYLFVDEEAILRGMGSEQPLRTERLLRRLNAGALFLKEADEPDLGGLFRMILEVMRRSEDYYQEEAAGLLTAFFAEMARKHPEPDAQEPHGLDESKFSVMLTDVFRYIEAHYGDPIRIKDLAALCHISETHFRRIFSSYMEMSPLDYINRVRVRMACDYLKRTDASIGDIAEKCGYSTNSTFNRNFRQLMGVSPMEWRKKCGNYERELLKFDIHSEEGW